MYAKPIQQLIHAFKQFPSVGERTAERFVFHLLKSGKRDVRNLIVSLQYLMNSVRSCEICWDFSDTSPCTLCADRHRDHSTICVVAESQDLHCIEKTNVYHGTYHVLRGTIDTQHEDTIHELKITELLDRVQKNNIKEIILALSPDIKGETTMLYIEKKIKNISSQTSISRLARGLPMGSDLQYADDITLGSALKNRTKR